MKSVMFLAAIVVAAPVFAITDYTDSFEYLNESFAVTKQQKGTEAPASRSAARPRFTEAGDPMIVSPSIKTRSQVGAETQEADRLGQLRYGEEGPAPSPVQVGPRLSGAQVAAEAREAARLGLLKYGEAGPREPTAAEDAQIRAAGLRAAEQMTVAK